jgi:hypothetical protein
MTNQAIQIEQLVPEIAKLPEDMRVQMPTHSEIWDIAEAHSGHRNNIDTKYFANNVKQSIEKRNWKWPKRRLYVITDPHADAEAFVASLVVSGGVVKTGQKAHDFKLTKAGKKGTFIIGGDCLDKGPSNLQLLKSIRRLLDTGANVKLLAGNHDMRLFMGIHSLGLKRKPVTEHLFVRMGEKVVPLLQEVHGIYLKGKKLSNKIPDEAECKKRLFPKADWFEQFPIIADGFMTEAAIKRELNGMRKKIDVFELACARAGLSMRDVYATAQKCRQLFLKPKGEFAWFYREMQLAYRKGSFLFIHAGLDDGIIDTISKKSIRYINRQFRQHIKKDLFHFYYGSLANTMRTKYRPADLPLSEAGVKRINRQGIHAVVHGHLNRIYGQRIVLKQGLIHIECDVTLDRASRQKEGLTGHGMGVTIIDPAKRVLGISKDYPFAKVFEPSHYLK